MNKVLFLLLLLLLLLLLSINPIEHRVFSRAQGDRALIHRRMCFDKTLVVNAPTVLIIPLTLKWE